jgi:hypothetical protein
MIGTWKQDKLIPETGIEGCLVQDFKALVMMAFARKF